MKIKKQLKLFPKKEKIEKDKTKSTEKYKFCNHHHEITEEQEFVCSCGDSRCGKLWIGDFGDGECEIGFVKYPNRKKLEGAIVLSVEEKNRLIKYLKSLK